MSELPDIHPTFTQSKPDELLTLARAGDAEALGALLAIYRRYMASVAHGQIGRQLQAKLDTSDLVQETCFEVHRHFSGFRGNSAVEFRAWLRVILTGLLRNSVRRYHGTRQRDPRIERSLAIKVGDSSEVLALPSNVGTPSEEVIKREASDQLKSAMADLPLDYQQVITLRFLQGLPFHEVAERMRRSVDSVEKLWFRALAKLRVALAATRSEVATPPELARRPRRQLPGQRDAQ